MELEKYLMMTAAEFHLVSRDWILMTTGKALLEIRTDLDQVVKLLRLKRITLK